MIENSVHILLVEDNKDHIELLRRAFHTSTTRTTLTVAENLLKARAYLTNDIPDLVIADLCLPDGKGTDLLDRSDKEGDYPVIIMAGQGNEHVAVEAIKSGALDYVVKSEVTLAAMPCLAERLLREWKTILGRKEAEKAVRISEAKYQDFYNYAPDMFLSVDLHTGLILECNQTLVLDTGFLREELLDRPLIALFHPECLSEVQHVLETVLETGEMRNSELRLLRKDGRTIAISMNMSAVYDERGRILFARSICRDITERKQAEEALRQTEERLRQGQKMEAIGTLASGIAHDFNNILSAIIGYSELTLTRISPKSREWFYLEQVLNAGGRARELVKQILDFSHQTEPHHIPVQLDRITQEVLQLMRASLPAYIEISQHFPEGLGTVLADPTQMHQVIVNLCANAGHAMRECGGRLDVRMGVIKDMEELAALNLKTDRGPYVMLKITDTGHGIPSEVQDRIFEPFFTTKPVGEGTGMGLSVVHGIITSHNGVITVESTPRQGSTFSVYLPQIPFSPPTIIEDKPSISLKQSRVLLVEDEEPLVQLEQQMLTQLGCEVVARTSSVDALETFRRDPDAYDVVITDQTMPKLTGEILAGELLKIRPNVPIILCTGYRSRASAEKIRVLGIKEYLEKPILMEDLALALATVRGISPELQV